MTDTLAIDLCRSLGWYIEEQKDYPDTPTGLYTFWWLTNPENTAFTDYSTYIDINKEPFYSGVLRCIDDYISQDDVYRRNNQPAQESVSETHRLNTLREVMLKTKQVLLLVNDFFAKSAFRNCPDSE